MPSRTHSLAALAALVALTVAPASAQDDGEAPEAVRPALDEDVDTIVVRARRSRGMAAFEAGDFATAEIEFQRNARCALRLERNREAALDQLRTGRINQETGLDVQPSGGINGRNGPPPVAPQGQPGQTAPAQNLGEGSDDKLDCGNRAFQIYMEGLSQLQLGKIEEAKESFRQAGQINKNLYDAQYRLGLIAVLENDEKEARWRLKAIKRILKRCRDCEVREEIIVRRDHLEAALNGEIARGDG